MGRWPDTSFDESMLESGVIIHCPDQDLVKELFEVLQKNGVRWYGGESMTKTFWDIDQKDTCYRVMKNKEMKRGNVFCYQDSEYRDYIKCTFYGTEPDVEIPDDGFEAIISARGG